MNRELSDTEKDYLAAALDLYRALSSKEATRHIEEVVILTLDITIRDKLELKAFREVEKTANGG